MSAKNVNGPGRKKPASAATNLIGKGEFVDVVRLSANLLLQLAVQLV